MKIVADENIPLLPNYFGHVGELVVKPGRSITRDDVLTADILLVRSVTKVNSELLAGTSVKFVGSSATGVDHLDTAWLDAAGIKWYAADGCNARAVVEYVVAVVASLTKQAIFPGRQLRAAVIGVGKIGSQVADVLKILGFEVVLCDPLRALRESNFLSVSLNDLSDFDLITLHTPLVRHGEYPTHHLIDRNFLQQQKKGCVLLNAGRGSVIDFSDLEEYGQHLYWCLDVWEHEPRINFEMLALAEIATPHIAGYSMQSKQRGVEMVYQAACAAGVVPAVTASLISYPEKTISFAGKTVDWCDAALRIFDPRAMTQLMKDELVEDGSGKIFDRLRRNFNNRYEFAYVALQDLNISAKDSSLLTLLGINK